MPVSTDAKFHTGSFRRKSGNRVASLALEQETHRLIQACKIGDESAWDALIRRYQPVIYRFARSLCPNREEVDDIVGMALLRLY